MLRANEMCKTVMKILLFVKFIFILLVFVATQLTCNADATTPNEDAVAQTVVVFVFCPIVRCGSEF